MSVSNKRRWGLFAAGLTLGLGVMTVTEGADAITRTEVMTEARAYAFHPWTATSSNMSASCGSNYSSWLFPGDFLGVAYDWGGFKSVFEFDQDIAAGLAAGSYNNYTSWPDTLSCTTGVDCSGYVSRCWDHGYKLGTWTIPDHSFVIDANQALPGDVFNDAGLHVRLFSHLTSNGEPVIYEATPPYNVWTTAMPWSAFNDYVPRRYDAITGTTASDPVGTPTKPIVVPPFPGSMYTDARNTAQSTSDVLDACGAAPGTPQEGPEYVYEITVTQPGILRATVSGDVSGVVDTDVHLYTSMNTSDCVARHNTEILEPVDCGTYYVVADSYGTDPGYAGAYNIQIELQNPGGACGSGPPSYDFEGGVGSPTCDCDSNGCGGYCNPNLLPGGSYCIDAGSNDYYCSTSCSSDSDCQGMLDGSCCQSGVCVVAAACGGGSGSGTGSGSGGSGAGTSGSGAGDSTGSGVGGDGSVSGSGAGDSTGSGTEGPATSSASDDDGDGGEQGGCSVSKPRRGTGTNPLAGLLLAVPFLLRRRRSRRAA